MKESLDTCTTKQTIFLALAGSNCDRQLLDAPAPSRPSQGSTPTPEAASEMQQYRSSASNQVWPRKGNDEISLTQAIEEYHEEVINEDSGDAISEISDADPDAVSQGRIPPNRLSKRK